MSPASMSVTVPSALASSAAMPQQAAPPIVSASLQPPPAGRRAQRSTLPSLLASQTAMNSPSGCMATRGWFDSVLSSPSRLSGVRHGPPRGR
jgi:hypothetical protein